MEASSITTLPQRGDTDTWEWWLWWADGEISVNSSLNGLPVDDEQFAKLVCLRRPGHMHSVPGRSGGWFVWDSQCHHPDDSDAAGKVVGMAAAEIRVALDELHRAVLRENGLLPDKKGKKRIADVEKLLVPMQKYAAGLARNAGKTAALGYMATLFGKSNGVLEDKHPHWLNCEDGTWDLRTLVRHDHEPGDLITYTLPAPCFSGRATPLFYQVILHLSGNDPAVAEFLLDLLGYSLLGRNPERKMVFLYGETSSGKTVVLDVMKGLLGRLFVDSSNDLVCVTRHGRNARTENSIAGARMVGVAESSEHKRVDEAQVKRLTGETRIRVDRHYAVETIDTPVTWTIWMPTNDLPSTGKPDSALRDRYLIVPTGPTVPPEKRDKDLAAKIIEQEGPAVLWMLMYRASRYLAAGELVIPHAVTMATDGYFGSQDSVAAFLREMCTDGDGLWIGKPDAWKNYQRWAGNDRTLSRNGFHAGMRQHVHENQGSERYEGVGWSENARTLY